MDELKLKKLQERPAFFRQGLKKVNKVSAPIIYRFSDFLFETKENGVTLVTYY